MSSNINKQCCSLCAWRATCNKRFCVSDGGARCPDFTRDLMIKDDSVDRENSPLIQEK
jgi:hypothetical protein